MRREWIEIPKSEDINDRYVSPSMRREWIEISSHGSESSDVESPSMRREWIEIVDIVRRLCYNRSLPPCGGSGLKYAAFFRKRL